MTATELLNDLAGRGIILTAVKGGRLKFRAPAGTFTAELKERVKAQQDELLAALIPDPTEKWQAKAWAKPFKPTPPPGVKLYFGDKDGRPCNPEDAHHRTWDGADEWFYASDHPVPPFKLAVGARFKKRCQQCHRQAFNLEQSLSASGAKQLRCTCASCGNFIGFLVQPPKNLDVEYHTA